jgi:hypothetical protein
MANHDLETIRQRLSAPRDGDAPSHGEYWNANPEFQRDLVWSDEYKRRLVDSIKKNMPFGILTTVNYNDEIMLIDGKQRATTVRDFLNDGFTDMDGLKFSQWSADDKARVKFTRIPVQQVVLDETEGEADIVELFRRINTQSKQLTTGQLLNSCASQPTMVFLRELFMIQDIAEDNEFAEEIHKFRDEWASIFCKTGFKINTTSKSRGDLKVLAGLVIPFLTGNNEAITTSFNIIFGHGLKNQVTSDMKRDFFRRMDMFLKIARIGYNSEYFKKLPKGYPASLAEISPFIFLVNIMTKEYGDEPVPSIRAVCAEIMSSDNLQTFFSMLRDNGEHKENWVNRLRKNRAVGTLTKDIKWIAEKLDFDDIEGVHDGAGPADEHGDSDSDASLHDEL